MQKGIYTIVNKDNKQLILAKNTHFFSEEEIKDYIATGTEREREIFMLIFNQVDLALQYIKINALNALVCGVEGKEAWAYYLNQARQNNVFKAIMNPCIPKVEHSCTLLMYSLKKIEDFENIHKTFSNL